MSTKTLNILNGLSHVLAKVKHDGALDEDGDPYDIGLRREDGHVINDSRVIDGFSVKTAGDHVWICYHADGLPLKDYHEGNIEPETESMIDKVKSFLQKEFKKTTGKSLSLKECSDHEFRVNLQYISRVRTACYAAKCYTLGGTDVESNTPESDESRLDSKFKSFLDQGGWGQKPKNQKPAARKSTETPFDPTKM